MFLQLFWGRQRIDKHILKWSTIPYFLNMWECQRLYFFLHPPVLHFYSTLVHLQKYCFYGLIWCHELMCHKLRKTVLLPLQVCSQMIQAVSGNFFFFFFFSSVTLASLSNSIGICIRCLGIAFDVIRVLISCLNFYLPPDVFFWFTLTPRSLYSVMFVFVLCLKSLMIA